MLYMAAVGVGGGGVAKDDGSNSLKGLDCVVFVDLSAWMLA